MDAFADFVSKEMQAIRSRADMIGKSIEAKALDHDRKMRTHVQELEVRSREMIMEVENVLPEILLNTVVFVGDFFILLFLSSFSELKIISVFSAVITLCDFQDFHLPTLISSFRIPGHCSITEG